MTPLRQRMVDELLLRNYADNTVERYVDSVESFARHFNRSPDRMGPEQIRQYLLHLIEDRNAAPNTVQIHRAALRFLYVRTLGRRWFDEQVARTRRHPVLPTVLSAEEITLILDHTSNLKHWTMIATFDATGLRANELRNLKVSDLDSRRMVIHVRVARGGVPRDIGLSPILPERLKVDWRQLRPKEWLFPSELRPDQRLEPKSIRVAISTAAQRAGIDRRVSPHVFRHSCATHLLEAGADLRTIQVRPGHANIQTTARYLRVSTKRIQALPSPLDALTLRPLSNNEGKDQE